MAGEWQVTHRNLLKDGGSEWESNPPTTSEMRPPVLKTGTVTGRHALPCGDTKGSENQTQKSDNPPYARDRAEPVGVVLRRRAPCESIADEFKEIPTHAA